MCQRVTKRLPWVMLVLIALVVLAGLGLANYLLDSGLRTIDLVQVGEDIVSVEVAVTPRERQKGLAGRAVLPQDHGMLFVYRDTKPRHYHMQGTRFDLDLIFISATGYVIETTTMRAGCTDVYHSKPARYVLEVAAGWAAEHGVEPGERVRFFIHYSPRE